MKGKAKTYCMKCRRDTWCNWKGEKLQCRRCGTLIDLRPTIVKQ